MRHGRAIAGLVALLSLGTPQSATPNTLTAPADPKPPEIAFEITAEQMDLTILQLASVVNTFVNGTLVYTTDQEQYGVAEKWVTLPQSGKGDCEDYALSKMELLRKNGVPFTNMQIVPVLVHKGGESYGHGILALRLPTKAVVYLDNRFDPIMTHEQLVAEGYEFFW